MSGATRSAPGRGEADGGAAQPGASGGNDRSPLHVALLPPQPTGFCPLAPTPDAKSGFCQRRLSRKGIESRSGDKTAEFYPVAAWF